MPPAPFTEEREKQASPMNPIYLDHAATTPVRPEVVDAMLPYFSQTFGNASSIHRFGQKANRGLQEARETVADCIGAAPEEIYFTSGGTESDNIAINGVVNANMSTRKRLIGPSIEHPAVLNSLGGLEKEGFGLTLLPVDSLGIVQGHGSAYVGQAGHGVPGLPVPVR